MGSTSVPSSTHGIGLKPSLSSSSSLTRTLGLTTWQSLADTSVRSFSSHFRLATFPNHAGETLTAFLAYTSLMHVIAPGLSRTLVPTQYNKLSPRTKVNWNVRVVSFVQASFISVAALRVILSRGRERGVMGRDDRLWGYDGFSGRVQAWAAGYFLWDLWVNARYVDVLGWSGLVHAACALMVTMLGFRPFANYYGVNFVLYEISTPFLGIHWALDKLGMTGGALQLYNGIALMTSFFGCRLVWGSYQTWLLSKDILGAWRDHLNGEPFLPRVILVDGVMRETGHVLAEAGAGAGPGAGTELIGNASNFKFPAGLLLTYLVANTVLSGLNFYWFGLMVKAMRKRFSGGDSTKGTKPADEGDNKSQWQ